MWGNSKKQSKSSEFFKGANLFVTLTNSIFGKIKETLQALFEPEYISEYKLPKVIVIGNESTGKSSLLENITKCQLFPRDSKLCTRCPIHVRMTNGPSKYVISYYEPLTKEEIIEEKLKLEKILVTKSKLTDEVKTAKSNRTLIKKVVLDKNNIYSVVLEYMNKIPLDTISYDELMIDITDNDVPTFEFYDLPGIRTYPLETATTTINLCRKYLADKNSIVLCVVPATTTRLTSCQSIALITEMNMQHNCILALTMADRLQSENIEELLIKRIIGTSDELKGLNFYGYVSIVNRLHSDAFSLEENDENEKKWFTDNIIECVPDEYKKYESEIKENITISNLLRKMDGLYSNFIDTNWKPKILKQINEKLSGLKNDYIELGEEPNNNIIINNINKILTCYLIDLYKNKIHKIYYCKYSVYNGQEVDSCEKYYKIRAHIDKIYDRYANNEHIPFITKISNDIANIAEYKLCRFKKANDKLRELILTNLKILTEQHLFKIKNMVIDSVNKDFITNDMDDYENNFSDYYELFILYPTLFTTVNFTFEDYEESAEHAIKRTTLLNKIKISEEHLSKIMDIKIYQKKFI